MLKTVSCTPKKHFYLLEGLIYLSGICAKRPTFKKSYHINGVILLVMPFRNMYIALLRS